MQAYLISELSQWITCQSIINKDIKISHLITDSRSVTNPENSCFIAISGKNHDGHHYIPRLYQQGVRCFMVEQDYKINKELSEANYLIVANSLKEFQNLVIHKRNRYNCPVIGITGSNGKTIVKEWISQLIGSTKILVRSPRSYNSQIGVPLSVWQLNANSELGIFEAGISQKGEMEKIAPIISPTIGLITNIGAAHQENFSSRKEKLLEKLKLFTNSQVIIYCADLPFIHEGIRELYPDKKSISWGTNKNADLRVVYKKSSASLTLVECIWQNEAFKLSIPFGDYVSFENSMHAISILLYLGYTLKYISQAVEKLVPVAMRMELKEGVNDCILINDSYNSDISSLALSLDFLNQQSKKENEHKTLILSDIYQSGIESTTLCKKINDLLKQKNITRLIGVGKTLKQHADIFEMDAVFYSTTGEFLQSISHNSFINEAILIKGSRNFEFEKVCSFLEKQHHQTCLEINLNALVDNLNFYRSKLKNTTKVLAMVKAFSYGSGSYEIANILEHQKVDYLGVAFADEGVELRKSGISLPIIVMNPEAKSFPVMLEHQLEPEIYSFKVFHEFLTELKKEGISSYPIHIKLDTGMKRLGFVASEMETLIELLMANPELRVKSAFSHLAAADEAKFDTFTKQQIDTFTSLTSQLENKLNYSFIKHILNSAGILRFPDAQLNMVRLGIGMYGIGIIEQKKLKSVTRFKSYISQIRQVKAHETIGYNRKGELPYDAEIAIVPVGYADGLNRRLGNGVGKMIVNRQHSRIVGNICMDMCMIDVTGLNAKEGNEVEIFGLENPVEELAKELDTIPYEIFTSISRRVKRIYYYE
jgi:alanine racemase